MTQSGSITAGMNGQGQEKIHKAKQIGNDSDMDLSVDPKEIKAKQATKGATQEKQGKKMILVQLQKVYSTGNTHRSSTDAFEPLGISHARVVRDPTSPHLETRTNLDLSLKDPVKKEMTTGKLQKTKSGTGPIVLHVTHAGASRGLALTPIVTIICAVLAAFMSTGGVTR